MAKLGGLVAVLLVALQLTGCLATPTPSVAPASAKLEDSVRPVSVLLTPPVNNLFQAQAVKQQQQQQQRLISNSNNNAEKLKRGLTNFMNQLNPAPYFVPAPVAGSKSAVQTGTSVAAAAESAAIVNPDPLGGDVLIKGPRLSQTRPIGGPLRWGRRR